VQVDAFIFLEFFSKDKGTGKSQQIRIEASSGLTDDEISKMKQEAEANADDDKKAKEKVDKLNSADAMIFQTEKQLKEYGEKLPADKKAEIEGALIELKEAHKNQDIEAIDAALEKMNAMWQAASAEMYQNTEQPGAEQQGAGAAGGDTGEGGSGDDDVTDVDFEEVPPDDKK